MKPGAKSLIAAVGAIVVLLGSLSIFAYLGFLRGLPLELRRLVTISDFQHVAYRATTFFSASLLFSRTIILMFRAATSSTSTLAFRQKTIRSIRRYVIVFSRWLKKWELPLVWALAVALFSVSFFYSVRVGLKFLTDSFAVFIVYLAVSQVYFRRLFATVRNTTTASRHRKLGAISVFCMIAVPWMSYQLGVRVLEDVERGLVEVHYSGVVEQGAIILKTADALIFVGADEQYRYLPMENIQALVF